MEKQLTTLPREKVARASIENFGVIYVAETMADAVDAINSLAPEHLEIVTNNAEAVAEQVRHAGVFSLAVIALNQLVITLQGQIMCCQRIALHALQAA